VLAAMASVMMQYEEAAALEQRDGYSRAHAVAKRQERDEDTSATQADSKKARVACDDAQLIRRSGRVRSQAVRAGFIDFSDL